MKAFIFAAIAALSFSAAPAMAEEFVGPKVGATVGYDNYEGEEGVSYGVVAGYDFKLAPKVVAGAEVAFSDSTVDGFGIHASRDLSASARLGYVVLPKALVFAKVGYATTRVEVAGLSTNFEGVRFGGGVELAVTDKFFISGEYVRTEYEAGIGGRDGAVATVGFRF